MIPVFVTARRVSVDAKARAFEFVLSKQVADRAGDVISLAGWKLDNYKRSPVVLWGHDHSVPAIGTCRDVRVTGDALAGTVQFVKAGVHPLADLVCELVTEGVINTGSVGFIPNKWAFRESDNGIDWLEQELIEFSIVNVPMLPEALAISQKHGMQLPHKMLRNYDEARTQLLSRGAETSTPTHHRSATAQRLATAAINRYRHAR